MPYRKAYPTDLTAGEWEILARLVPPAKPGGRPRSVALCAVLDAVFHLGRGGLAWRLLPRECPAWQTVHPYFPPGAR